MPPVEATNPRPRIHDRDDDPPPTPAAPAARPNTPSTRADAAIDADVAAAVAFFATLSQTPGPARYAQPAVAAPPAAPTPPKFNDRITYVGFNATSRALELQGLGGNVSNVIAASSSSLVKVGTTTYDLSTDAGVDAFAGAIASGDSRNKLAALLHESPVENRDEIAKMAKVWAPAEHGASIPSRLVLSGHNWGGFLYSHNPADGTLPFEAVRELGKAFPKAAAQIEDIHLACCLSEREVQNEEDWRQSFPNAKTMWGYSSLSPEHPADHLHAWELATRGRANTLGEGLLQSHQPATAWSVRGGFANESAPLDVRRERAADAQTRFNSYLTGDHEIKSPYEPAAEHDYAALRSLGAARDATPTEKATANAQADQLVKLRYWNHTIRGEIAKHYGADINAALAKEGLAPVDFSTMSRKEALTAIEQYRQKHGSLGPTMQGIVNLTAPTIDGTWCS